MSKPPKRNQKSNKSLDESLQVREVDLKKREDALEKQLQEIEREKVSQKSAIKSIQTREAELKKREGNLEKSLQEIEGREASLKSANASIQAREVEWKKREDELQKRIQMLEKGEKDLHKRKLQVEVEEMSLKSAQETLQRERKDLTSQKKSLEKREDEYRKHLQTLTDKELELDRRLVKIVAREQAVADDCQQIRLEKTSALQKQLTELREKAEADLEEKLEKERHRRLKALEQEITDRREQAGQDLTARRTATEEDLRYQREKLEELITTRTSTLDIRKKELDHQREELSKERSELDEYKAQLVEREAGLEQQQRKLAQEEAFLASREQELDAEADHRAAQKVQALEYKCQQRDERIAGLQEDLDIFQRRLDAYEDWRNRFGEREPEDILNRLRTLETELDKKREELHQRPSMEDKERLQELERAQNAWDEHRRRLTRELGEANTKLTESIREHGLVEQQRDLYETEKRRRETLNVTVDALEEEVKRLQGIYEKPIERKTRIGTIEVPIPTLSQRLQGASSPRELSELDWLAGITKRCEDIHFQLPQRLLYAFHTSLKTADASPLTVLAGVSGTGKSMLPRLYAHFGGLQFFDVPVRPDWDSPQSLFGFFNSIDNQFDSTPLLRAMVQASKSSDDQEYRDGFADRMMIVLLDEMNLAHIELYFSDLLSKLESRRSNPKEALSIDLGSRVIPYELPLSSNVLWTGTMNQDATTKSLSDKVLDRSNIIMFPRPDEFIRRFDDQHGNPTSLLHRETWNGWSAQQDPFADAEIIHFKESLEQVNSRLESVGRALGHRVWQSVENYMLYYPTVIEARRELRKALVDEKNQDNEHAEKHPAPSRDRLETEMRKAFEDQVVQTVMPKLRGIETRGHARSECLDPIRQILVDELKLALEEDFEIACKTGQGRFIWNSARYIKNA